MARTSQEAVDDLVKLYNGWVSASLADNANDDQTQWITDFDNFGLTMKAILTSAPNSDGHPNGHPTHPPKP